MPKVKLCKVTVVFSSEKKKRDFVHFIALNEVDFCKNLDNVKQLICEKFNLVSVTFQSLDFDFLEVIE